MSSRLHRGLAAESLAFDHLLLVRAGARPRLLARNFRWRGGEIDIILEEQTEKAGIELVFVEVRSRSLKTWVSGIESVSVPKQFRLRRTIERFLANYRGPARSVRVDILAWDGEKWTEARNVRLAGEYY
jgi:putative endonuclease